jgi:hypothetical protein
MNNADLVPVQQIIAGEFANVLITLGVLPPETKTDKVVANALKTLPRALRFRLVLQMSFRQQDCPILAVWGILLRIGGILSNPTSEIRPEVWRINTSTQASACSPSIEK